MKGRERAHLHPRQQRLLHRRVHALREGLRQLRRGREEACGGEVHQRLHVGGRQSAREEEAMHLPSRGDWRGAGCDAPDAHGEGAVDLLGLGRDELRVRGEGRRDGGRGEAGVAEPVQPRAELGAVVLEHLQRLRQAQQLREGEHSGVRAVGGLLADDEGGRIDGDALVQQLGERRFCARELPAIGSLQEG